MREKPSEMTKARVIGGMRFPDGVDPVYITNDGAMPDIREDFGFYTIDAAADKGFGFCDFYNVPLTCGLGHIVDYLVRAETRSVEPYAHGYNQPR